MLAIARGKLAQKRLLGGNCWGRSYSLQAPRLWCFLVSCSIDRSTAGIGTSLGHLADPADCTVRSSLGNHHLALSSFDNLAVDHYFRPLCFDSFLCERRDNRRTIAGGIAAASMHSRRWYGKESEAGIHMHIARTVRSLHYNMCQYYAYSYEQY